jgi:MSHA biogenesis protein MshK
MKPLPLALAAATCSLAAWVSYAQVLTDPTRPPSVQAPTAEAGGEAPPQTQLQSILISRGRKLAVINGQTVPLGGKVGEATLVSVRETEVVLRSGDATEVLKLHPNVEKRPVRRPVRAREQRR